MIISFFSSGTGGGAAPVDYLTAREVLAYDENRNLIRDDRGQPQTKIRDPLPVVLHGNPDRTRDLIDASANKWSYTAGVISFAEADQPSEDAQQEAIELFEALAFAGLEADQYDCLWVRHVHEGNVELHFCTPRLELVTGRALNIAPPGHEAAFSTLRDVLNKTHGWADPMEPDLARDFKLVRESADRAEARQVIVGALYDQIDAGLITDRASMMAFFVETGFEVTRQAAKSISVRDPEFAKPFKLEGVLTHENWSPTRHVEIAAEYETGADANRTRRLDGISHDSLRADLADHVERRADYNEERYGALSVSTGRTGHGWCWTRPRGAHSIANGVRGCVARLAERGLELREAAHATRDELEISESRREAAERDLDDAREREADYSHGYGL